MVCKTISPCLHCLIFFYTKTTYLLIVIALSRYINFACGNWDNYNPKNDFIFYSINNDGPKSEFADFNEPKINSDNPDEFYGIYNWLTVILAFLVSKLLAVLAFSSGELLAISAFLTSKGFFFFFFLDGLPVKINAALQLRFYVFLAFSSIFLIVLTTIYIFLAFLSSIFLAKASAFFLFFSGFFFFIFYSLAVSF